MQNIFHRLVYIYMGTDHYPEDKAYYIDMLGARLVWEFSDREARVCCVDLCGLPYLLLADHVEAPSKRLIYQTTDLREAIRLLKLRGWQPQGRRFEIPDGTCCNFADVSGNTFSLLQMTRPFILEKEFEKNRKP